MAKKNALNPAAPAGRHGRFFATKVWRKPRGTAEPASVHFGQLKTEGLLQQTVRNHRGCFIKVTFSIRSSGKREYVGNECGRTCLFKTLWPESPPGVFFFSETWHLRIAKRCGLGREAKRHRFLDSRTEKQSWFAGAAARRSIFGTTAVHQTTAMDSRPASQDLVCFGPFERTQAAA